MLAQLKSMSVIGIDAFEIEVQVDVNTGIPVITIVGLPDKAVCEARERVRAALRNGGFDFPQRRITVNLAPADIKKEGPAFDLPMAVGILMASEQVRYRHPGDIVVIGELSLDGTIREVDGVLPMAMEVRRRKLAGIVVPRKNLKEALIVGGISIYPVSSLRDVAEVLEGRQRPMESGDEVVFGSEECFDMDYSEVRGQNASKRALEIAAAGNHNLLMIGPPGSGKTMLARRMQTILPPLTFEESMEVTKLYSIQGLISRDHPLVTSRPFRAPHHSSSYGGLIGGGTVPKPGEISMAHHGVLFLDEIPEFSRNVLDMLRQPLEEGKIRLSRARASLCYPAAFMLLASMNPCPCGYSSDREKSCECSPAQVKRYMARLSGPLLDRFDMHIEVPRLSREEIRGRGKAESSEAIKARVIVARALQAKRGGSSGTRWNSQMRSADLKAFCRLSPGSAAILQQAMDRFRFSMRSYVRILRVARTIADLASRAHIEGSDIAEALQYRFMDRQSV